MIDIIGCDQSLTHTALTVMRVDGKQIVDTKLFFTTKVKKSKKIKFNSDNITQITLSKEKGIKHMANICHALSEHLGGSDESYFALEGGSFASTGALFNLGQLSGIIQYVMSMDGLNVREYEPTKIKMFATKKGAGGKEPMLEAFMDLQNPISKELLDYYHTPDVKADGLMDMIDSYYIAQLLYTELMLRKGFLLMNELPEHIIKCFNRVTKKYPVNLLARDFLKL